MLDGGGGCHERGAGEPSRPGSPLRHRREYSSARPPACAELRTVPDVCMFGGVWYLLYRMLEYNGTHIDGIAFRLHLAISLSDPSLFPLRKMLDCDDSLVTAVAIAVAITATLLMGGDTLVGHLAGPGQ